MKRLKGTIWGTLLTLTLTATTLWAQGQPPAPPQDQQQPQDQAQSQEQQYPEQTQAPAPPQDQQTSSTQESDQHDPPGRVARLQYMSGSVSVQPEGTGDWVAGAINRPLTNADNVWTDKDSRAELNVGGGVLRMNSESSLTLTNISDNAVQVQLHQGTLNLRVRHLFGSEIYEVDTPNMAFTVQKGGEYRFDVDPNGDTTVVTVWKGEGDATGNGPSVAVRAHERARFTNGNSLTHEVAQAPGYDGFDDWCRVRDERQDHSVSARYVAPGVIGYEDLDEYGTWRDVAPYGAIWVPSGVAVGWAPYTNGHWIWVAPWGWTWVDYYPWGFAPFHYGRWVYTGGYWGWAPGPYWGQPYYAPALVAWFGGPYWGASFGFGFGGGIGWCALGWGEPFYPWYHGGRRYFRNINVYNTRIGNINRITNEFYGGHGHLPYRYANLHAPGGAVAVSRRTLVNSLPVRGTAMRVPVKQFARAPLGGNMRIAPDRVSRLGVNAGRPTAMPPAHSFSRSVVSRMAAPGGMRPSRTETASFNRGSRPGQGARSAGRPGPASVGSSHYVPRPPMGNSASGRSSMTARNYVPRPSAGRSFGQRGATDTVRGGPRPGMNSQRAPNNRLSRPSSSPQMRSAPRGPSGRGYSVPNRSVQPNTSRSPRNGSRSSNFVPRPTGPVRQAPYASNSYGGRSASPSYSSRGYYGGSSRSYGATPRSNSRPSYTSPSYRGYSAPANRSYSAPSRRGYSAPSRSYSAPSSRGYSAPSYHGSSGYSGGGRSYSGGGGHSYSGGGGGHSYGGGGGHSSGGGHSGRR